MPPTSERLIHELRRKLPGLSGRSLRGSRGAAIRLFCLECMGGSRPEVKACSAPECPLFLYRDGHWHKEQTDA